MKTRAERINVVWQVLDTVLGVLMAFFFGMAILGFFISDTSSEDIPAFVVCVALTAWGIYLIARGAKRGKLGKAFREYIQLLGNAPRISLDALAEETGASPDAVRRNLQWMLRKGFFENAKLDDTSNSLILRSRVPGGEMLRVRCSSCGAPCMVPLGRHATCEYCGTMLKGEE